MFIYVVVICYLLGNTFILMRILSWLKSIHKPLNSVVLKRVIIIFYILMAVLPIIAFLLPLSNLKRLLQLISNDFMGVYIYMLMMSVIFCIVYLIFKVILKKDADFFKLRKYLYTTCLVTISVISISCIYGIMHARKIYVNNYDVTIKKATAIKKLKIALIADLHLGYNVGYKMIEKMTIKINKENPDIVIIAGDVYDNNYDTLDNPNKIKSALKGIKSKYGTYAVFGNHDVKETLFAGFSVNSRKKHSRDTKMEELLKKSNIEILDDQNKLIDDSFYLVGRKDYKQPGKGSRKSITTLLKNVSAEKPIILIDHEPINLVKNSNNNVDLELSGHTHDGQFFPLNLANNFIYENSYGQKEVNNMISIVTSGIGVYGPNMRIGTNSEIAIINVSFK